MNRLVGTEDDQLASIRSPYTARYVYSFRNFLICHHFSGILINVIKDSESVECMEINA